LDSEKTLKYSARGSMGRAETEMEIEMGDWTGPTGLTGLPYGLD